MITPPPRIGRFTVARVLGHGGMGVVYLARDPQLGRDVAIKVLPPLTGDAYAERLLNEARLSGRFVHPNVIAIYEVGEELGSPFFVMPYVAGRTLDAIVKAREPVPLGLKLRWMVELCRGLDYAHGFHVIHRDVKPANLIVDGHDVLRILDFGIAKLVATTQASFTAVGTPAYMAPEQYSGAPVDARTDVYAAGLVLFELLTYARARSGDTPAQVYRQIAGGELPALRHLVPDIDPAIAAICQRATAVDPAARFQTAREMGDALSRTQTRAAYREEVEAAAGDEPATVPGTLRVAPPLPSPPWPPAAALSPPQPGPPPMAVAAPPPAQPGWNTDRRTSSLALPLIVLGTTLALMAIAALVLFTVLWKPTEPDGATAPPGAAATAPPTSPVQTPIEAPRPATSTRTTPPPSDAGAAPPRETAPADERRAPLPPPPPAAPVRVGGTIREPTKTRNVQPVYPSIAQSARVQGIVIIEATIGPTGAVRDARILRSIPLLDQAALDAVRQWEFTPTLLNGVAVPVIMTVTVNFTLTSDAPDSGTPSASPAPMAATPAADSSFSGDAGLLLVQIAAGSEPAYERLLRRVRDALHATPGRAAMASGWQVYRGGTTAGNALYVHVVDRPVKGADYVQLYRLVNDAFPSEVRDLAAPLGSAFVSGGTNRANLRLARTPTLRGGTKLAGLRAADARPTFTTSSGLVLAVVKPTEGAAYENAFYAVTSALSASPKPERRAMYENWLLFRSEDAPLGGGILYVSRIDPVVPGADYLDVYTLVNEARGDARARAAVAEVQGALLRPALNVLQLTLVLNMSARN